MGAVLMCGLGISRVAPATDIYQWKDASGRVHFGDKLPGGAEALPIRQPPARPPVSQQERQQRTQRLLNEYATERNEREEARAEIAAALAERRRVCADARNHLYEVESAGYLYDRDAAGNKQILPEVELRLERERARAHVKDVCQGDAAGAPARKAP